MNRRDFLKSLLAIGGSVTLPLEAIETAPEEVIDQAWVTALKNPMTFFVGDSRDLSTDRWPAPLGYENEGRADAMRFFDEDFEFNELLGIDIVEGCCPGSDFFAAVLSKSLAETNELARLNGIPIQFAWVETPLPSEYENEDNEEDEPEELPEYIEREVRRLSEIALAQLIPNPQPATTYAAGIGPGILHQSIAGDIERYWREHRRLPSGRFEIPGRKAVQLPEQKEG